MWALLLMNTLTYSDLPVALPLPRPLGQLITQGSLLLAFGLALAMNPRVKVRLNIVLALFSLMCVIALMTSLHNEFYLGSVYRAGRYALFICVLWLLTPAWGSPTRPLLRAHLAVLTVVLGSVVVGFVVAPGAAMSYGGRLSGALWPIPPTQVAHYAAVFVGLIVLHWLLGMVSHHVAIVAVVVGAAVLLATHTRTAVMALLIGLAVAVGSLFLGYARVRRASTAALLAGASAAIIFAPLIGSWLLRDQSADELGQLTGRTAVWEQVFATPRPYVTTLFGSGMSNASFDGLPIDSNWVATYLDLGVLGITVQVLAVLVLLVTALVRPRGLDRAVAVFLLLYFVIASFTETGLNSPSAYLLEIVVAASLLARPLDDPVVRKFQTDEPEPLITVRRAET